MNAFDLIPSWGATNATAAAVVPGAIAPTEGRPAQYGDVRLRFRIASVSKVLVAYAGLVALEEGTISLEDPAGPPGATVRHLLSHTAGYGFTGHETIAPVGRRRIYSNTGIEVFAELHAGGVRFLLQARFAVSPPTVHVHAVPHYPQT